ncbi:MAG TPA: N,N-dimethylformamidase beta subunit family domain-containing protein, partial [Candidatus Methylomirabilis sp.]|nr:N,N-dimethylformamidase beta subunit family domain-containing protein [Candidatus Methylomirabilis sp.]
MKICGYTDRLSAPPGQSIRFMVNCELGSYRVDTVRLVCGDANPRGPGVKEIAVETPVNGTYPGRHQVIESGSYVAVPHRERLELAGSFSLQAMVWPTTPGRGEQVVAAKWSDADRAGVVLMLDASGAFAVKLGSGRAETFSTGKPLLAREWYFVAATFDAGTRELVLYQEPVASYPRAGDVAEVRTTVGAPPAASESPLMFAACRAAGGALAGKYNGKIEGPRLCNRALSRTEMEMLKAGPIPMPLVGSVVGAWDFWRDMGSERVTDSSANLLHGRTVNLPARAMKGSSWTGEVMDWRQAPEQYGAIHFHDDDLYDAGWQVDFTLTVPPGMKSGLYAARLRAGEEEDYIPFVVAPAPGQEKRIALLLPTASYMAYANEHMAANSPLIELVSGRLIPFDKYSLFLNEHREYGLSCYDSHSDGSGVCYSSRLRPILNMRPKHISSLGGAGSSLWQFNADTHITDWLEARGYDFDVITDEDLHERGAAALMPYRAVLSGSHPEYHSPEMWTGLKGYLDRGGRLMSLGANGWYWKIAYHPALPGVIEVRRNEDGVRTWAAEPGEYYGSFTGSYGGLWRRQGKPPQMIVGTGFSAQGFDVSAPYRRLPDSFDPRAAFVFEGIGADEVIGDFGLIGGGAAGLELDRADRLLGTPPHALVLATSKGGHTDIYLVVPEEVLATYPGLGGEENELVRADMVFFETPGGGAVWSTSSIAWSGSLSHNGYRNNV